MKTRMPRKPAADRRRIMRSIIAHHDMDLPVGWDVRINGAEELQELAAAMPTM